jgi:deferrochelatase/peroxidase EfeB
LRKLVSHGSRGLLFLSYQRSITDQFETLNTNWMNNSGAPASFGFDLLVGQHLGGDGRHAAKEADFFGPQSGQTQRFSTLAQWVKPTGGAYLFAPSVSWTERNALLA